MPSDSFSDGDICPFVHTYWTVELWQENYLSATHYQTWEQLLQEVPYPESIYEGDVIKCIGANLANGKCMFLFLSGVIFDLYSFPQ